MSNISRLLSANDDNMQRHLTSNTAWLEEDKSNAELRTPQAGEQPNWPAAIYPEGINPSRFRQSAHSGNVKINTH
jgi:hypothetical protein